MTAFFWKTGWTAQILPLSLLGVGLLVAVAVYYPGLSGPFFFDDIFHIQNNTHLRMDALKPATLELAAFSTNAGPLQRPLSMASFALNYYFVGDSVTGFKAINLGIHLVNGIVIFLFASRLFALLGQRTGRPPTTREAGVAAALVAILWLVHPLNMTSVLYVVQRMTSLSALFVLLALLSYLKARLARPEQRVLAIALFAASLIFWLFALASKENALLLPWYIFLIEWLCLYSVQPGQPPSRGSRVYTFAWLVVPIVIGLAYLALHPGLLHYDLRPFTLWERVLTEARALWFYLGLIVLPRPAALGIFHDDFPLSTGLLTPWATLPSVLGVLLVMGLAVRYQRKVPYVSFGVLFFLAAHALESSIFPLEVMHEHRNYLAMFGLLLALVGSFVLSAPSRWRLRLRLRMLIVGAFAAFFGALTLGRAINWQNVSGLTLSQVDRHPASFASNYEAGRLYFVLRDQSGDLQQQREFNALAIQHFSKAAVLSPLDATGPLAVLFANATGEAALDETALAAARGRLRQGVPNDVSLNLLLSLSRCERSEQCSLIAGEIDSLFDALLSNPRLVPLARAALLDESALRAASRGAVAEADPLFKEVLALNPINAMYRINYASVLIRLNRLEEAGDQIRHVLASPQAPATRKIAEAVQRRLEQTGTADHPDGLAPAIEPQAVYRLKDLLNRRDGAAVRGVE